MWRIDLFGTLSVTHLQSGQTITHFRTHKTGALLAYLAYYSNKPHPREVLAEMLWPDVPPHSARHNLCNALAALRCQIERSKHSEGTVFTVNRFAVQLNSAIATTDVAAFEDALQSSTQIHHLQEKLNRLLPALDGFNPLLLSGYYEDWILPEQQRLQENFMVAACECIRLLQLQGNRDRAIALCRRVVHCDPLYEANNRLLMELLADAGQTHSALRQYREFSRTIQQEMGQLPSSEMQGFIQHLLLRKTHPKPQSTLVQAETAPQVPARLTRFFGRDREKTLLERKLITSETRLLTLTGPGGIGKTRLALELADAVISTFAGAVWFVSLADLPSDASLLLTVQNTLSVSSPQSEPFEALVAFLSRQRSLLVLDNFEHLIASGALWVQTLLERIPMLTCLVTSRQRLQLSGEVVFPVTPLSMSGGAATPESVMLSESVRLFVDRAQSVRPEFTVSAENAPALAELCDRLEGIPLALELAAARAQTLTPEQMRTQMQNRFDFLVSKHSDRTERHRSLRDTLIWSYRLLTPQAQVFLSQLSVFRGGWTWETAEAVCGEPQALELLAQLCECSLVIAEEAGAEIRFRMLETVREFAQEQLEASEREHNALAAAHATHFLTLVETTEPLLKSAEQTRWLTVLERELDNLRAALTWCRDHPEGAAVGLQIAGAAFRFWYVRGHFKEGRTWVQAFLARTDRQASTPELARALNSGGCLAWAQSDLTEAHALLEACVRIRRTLGDDEQTAKALNNLSIITRSQGDLTAAMVYQEEALALQRHANNIYEIALCLNNMANIREDQRETEAAISLYRESLPLWRTTGDAWGLALTLSNLGNQMLEIQCYDEARCLLEEALPLQRTLDDPGGIAYTLLCLGQVVYAQGDYAAASLYLEESLTRHEEIGDKIALHATLQAATKLALAQGDLRLAETRYAAALRLQADLALSAKDAEDSLLLAERIAEARHSRTSSE